AYTSAGVSIFDASIAAPITYADTFSGAGNSGFVFGLNSEQAASFSAAVTAAGVSFSSLRAGLSASASSAEGGFETFFIANSNLNPPVAAVPEPETYALLLAGLVAVGFVARRRGSR
ncbi:MAG: PEP-CTERM sorting domain-containing protein, partial [Burkholderiaceae bacterium]